MSAARSRALIIASIVLFFTLALGNVLTTSPAMDEVPHLVAGMTYIAAHDYRVAPEHPPLIKLVAAASLAGLDVWPRHFRDDGSEAFQRLKQLWPATRDTVWAQWPFAVTTMYAVRDEFARAGTVDSIPRTAFRNDSTAIFHRARITLLLLTSGGLLAVIILWSRELWGWSGAAISTAFYCADPNFIAHSGLVTTDPAVTLFMFGSVYFFWRLTRAFTAGNVAGFAVFTALAAVTKFSSFLLVAIIGVLLISTRSSKAVIACAIALAATIVGIWSIYGFRFDTAHGTLPIGALSPPGIITFANDHRLLPQSYLYGIARMHADADRASYLRGEKRAHGFWSYFFWTVAVKTPLPTLAAILTSLALAFTRRVPSRAFLLVPPAIYFAVAVVFRLNIGHRHLLPIYPFLYVLCGILSARWFAACALSFLSCLVVFTPFDPMWGHHLSYFNELARGPRHGWEIVADSNIDWGQDLPRLATWLRQHRVAEPISFVYFGVADPRYYGIRYVNLRGGYFGAPEVPPETARVPGILAISTTVYSGAWTSAADQWKNFVREHRGNLVGRAGYSILIFRLDQAVTGRSSGFLRMSKNSSAMPMQMAESAMLNAGQ